MYPKTLTPLSRRKQWLRLLSLLSLAGLLQVASGSEADGPVASERKFADKIADLGGWCEIDNNGHVVEVNMAYQLTAEGQRIKNVFDNDDALAIAPHFQKLERLVLSGPQASDHALSHLERMKNLRELTLLDATEVTDVGIRCLIGCSSLRRLHVTNSGIGNESLQILSQLSELKELFLKNNALTDDGLSHLAQMRQLEQLHIGGRRCKVTDAGIRHIASLPLTELGLQNCQITDAGVAQIARLSKLEGLWHQGAPVTDSGVAYLVGLPLKRLGLTNTEITDAGAVHMARIESLERLWVGWTELTEGSLRELGKLKQLQVLVLPKGVSAASIQEFQRQRRDLLVSGEMWPPSARANPN